MNQETVEALYSKRQIHTVLHEAIRYELDKVLLNWSILAFVRLSHWLEQEFFSSKEARVEVLREKVEDEGLESLVIPICAAVIHTHNIQTIQQAAGYLQAFLPHEDAFDRARTAAELLALCSHPRGLYEIKRNGSGVPATIQVNQWKWIDDKLLSSFDWVNDTCFNPPLIEPPIEVVDNYGCGYHTIREPLILGTYTMHDDKQNYAAINILNSIEWVLDPEVLKERELPSKPLANQQAHENFVQMVQDSQFVYKLLGSNPFWFAWQYDCRGRMYSHGYHVNFQAAEYKKAMLNFNHFEEVTT